MTSHDKSTSISQCCNNDCNQGRDCPLMQEEFSAGFGALWFAVCAVIVCGAVVWWVLV